MKLKCNLYTKAHKYLANHKKLSLFLSHGGVHLFVLICLCIVMTFMMIEIVKSSRKIIHNFDIEITDDCDNYELNQLQLEIKPKSRIKLDFKPSYLFFINGKFGKKSPFMKGSHMCDTAKSNIPTIFPWGGMYAADIDWHWLGTSNFINYLAENCPSDSLDRIFFIPSQYSTPDEIRVYLKERTSYLLDSLNRHGISSLSPITENDFLKFTSTFLRRNSEIFFFDSVSSKKSFRFTIANNFKLDQLVKLKINGDMTENCLYKITKKDNSFSVVFKGSDNRVTHSFPTDIASEKNSPYLNLQITIKSNACNLNENSIIDIDITPVDSATLYAFKEIYPTPTSISLNRVKYIGKEAVENIIRNGGVYIEAEDVKLSYRKDKIFILNSVLLGTIIAFAIDIIIQLVYKWRRLQP